MAALRHGTARRAPRVAALLVGSTSSTYDAVGNRLSLVKDGVTTNSTYDAANRMTAAGADTYGYDANGNQTSKVSGGVTTTFTYDALDRLTGIGAPVGVSYGSTGDGPRVSLTISRARGGASGRFLASLRQNRPADRGGRGRCWKNDEVP